MRPEGRAEARVAAGGVNLLAVADAAVETLTTPYLLLASPALLDPNFRRTVVLMGHHDEEGALGWVVNRVVDGGATALLPASAADGMHPETPLRVGGPVATPGLLVLHRAPVDDVPSSELAPGLFVSGATEILKPLFGASPEDGAPRGLLVFGYAGWGPGQLEHEMEEGSWLVLPYDEGLAFPLDTETLWERALARLGASPETVAFPSGGMVS